jgi:sterol-4alpha-carboxylate 3-dehydrogenase (decarboxylating)
MGDRFLIVGGMGFLGFHIIEDLIKQKKPVAAFDIQPSRDPEVVELCKKYNLKIYFGDLCKKEDVANAINDFKATAIINTASPPPLGKNFELFKRVNVDGAKVIMDACIENGVKKFVVTCSCSVTEDEDNVENGTELTTKYITDSHYNAYYKSKMLQEKLVISYNGKGGLMTCSLRPHRIFGPRDVTVTPKLIDVAITGRNKFYLGDGTNKVDWTYVKNVSYAHILAVEKLKTPDASPAGNFFYITNDEPMKFWDFVGTLWETMGYSRPYIGIPYWVLVIICYIFAIGCFILKLCGKDVSPPPEYDIANVNLIVRNRYYDISKAKKELGYKPLLNMKESIIATADYYRDYAQKKTK